MTPPLAAREDPGAPDPRKARKFNRTKGRIEWAGWSWNPVTGCLTGCPYCYAREQAARFPAMFHDFKPTFYPERLDAPRNTRRLASDDPADRNVFTCSMADLFGPWVPNEWIDAVMAAVRSAPEWNFIFLTKFPRRMASVAWPDNTWIGATVDTQGRVEPTEDAFAEIPAGVKFVSIEPMQEAIRFNRPEVFSWYILGGRRRTAKVPAFTPPMEWRENLYRQARGAGALVFQKENLGVPEGERIREYPEAGG